MEDEGQEKSPKYIASDSAIPSYHHFAIGDIYIDC